MSVGNNNLNRRRAYANADDHRITADDVRKATLHALRRYLEGLSKDEFEARVGKPHDTYLTDADLYALDEWNKITKWREAVMDVLEGVCSILGAVNIPFHYTKDGLAMTNGEEVYIGLKWFNNEILPAVLNDNVYDAVDAYALLKGLAYHELSHVRFTARFNHEPTKTIRSLARKANTRVDSFLFKAYNILEDMRIERLFVGEFAPAKVLFTNLVMRYIVDEVSNKADNLHGVYVMIAGRDYLSKNVRRDARNALVDFVDTLVPNSGHKVAKKVDDLVTEYCGMTFPRDNRRAVEIVREYAKLILMLNDGGVSVDSTSSTESTLMREWEADHPYWVDEAHKTAGDVDTDLDEDEEDSKATTAGESDESPDADDTAEGDATDTEGAEEADANGGASDSPADAEGEPADGEGGKPDKAGSDGDSPIDTLMDTVRKEKETAHEKALDVARDDLKSINKKLTREGHGKDATETSRGYSKPVDGYMRSDAKKLKSYIRTVFSDIEPEYVGGHSSGRLNVRDLMDARGTHTDVFDVWKDHGDGSDFEVVLAIDTSGSMGTYRTIDRAGNEVTFNEVSMKAMWTIHRAFTDLEIPVTVVEFNSDANVLISPKTRCSSSTYNHARATGGTETREAFAIAKHIFAKSNAEHKLLVTLTDGEWNNCRTKEEWDNSLEKELMALFSATGVHSILVTYENDSTDDPDRGVPTHNEDGKFNGHDRIVRLRDGRHGLLGKEVGKAVVELANKRILAG